MIIDTSVIERATQLAKKDNLKAFEYAFTLAVPLAVAAEKIRQGQQRQLKVDPAWTEVDMKPGDVERLADVTKELVEVLLTGLDADLKAAAQRQKQTA